MINLCLSCVWLLKRANIRCYVLLGVSAPNQAKKATLKKNLVGLDKRCPVISHGTSEYSLTTNKKQHILLLHIPSFWQKHELGTPSIYSAVQSKWVIFITIRVAELDCLWHGKSFINQKVSFLYENNLLLGEKPSNFPFSMTIQGFTAYLLLHFVSSKGEWEKNGSNGTSEQHLVYRKFMKFAIKKGSEWKWTNPSKLCFRFWNPVKWYQTYHQILKYIWCWKHF